MKITVIIPVYNRAQLLKRAVESVFAQTCPPERLIVVDDGSVDDPEDSLRDFTGDDRLRIISQENQGVSAARNKGIAVSETDWLAFLDSDDWWLPDKLDKQISWHNVNPDYLISQTDEIWIRNGRQVHPRKYHQKRQGDIFGVSLERCLISPSAVLINRHLIDEVGLFDPTLPVCEDYDLWLRITARYPVGLVPEKLIVKTGGHDDQLSRKYWGMDRFRVTAIKKLLDSGVLTDTQREAAVDIMNKKAAIFRNGAEKRREEKRREGKGRDEGRVRSQEGRKAK